MTLRTEPASRQPQGRAKLSAFAHAVLAAHPMTPACPAPARVLLMNEVRLVG